MPLGAEAVPGGRAGIALSTSVSDAGSRRRSAPYSIASCSSSTTPCAIESSCRSATTLTGDAALYCIPHGIEKVLAVKRLTKQLQSMLLGKLDFF